MKNILAVSILLFLGLSAKCQDRGLYTQYYMNWELVNPAFTGTDGEHEILFNYRNRWAGFPGNPKMISVAYDGLITDRVGLGAQLHTENIGALNRLRLQLQYAYHFGNEDLDMSIGLTTEYHQYSLDSDVLTSDFYDADDPIIMAAADNVSFFDMTLGVHGTYRDDLSFGVALPSLIRTRISDIAIEDFDDTLEESPLDYYFVYAAYRLDMTNGDYYLEPSLAVKKVRRIDTTIDFNLKAGFLDDRLIGGLSYSTGAGNRFGFLVGTNIDNIQFIYSYDASFLDYQEFNAGGHEITIGLTLGQMTNNTDQATDATNKF